MINIKEFQYQLYIAGITNLKPTNRDRYRKAVSLLLDQGVSPELVVSEPFKGFKGKFKYKFIFSGKYIAFGQQGTSWTYANENELQAMPDRYRNVDKSTRGNFTRVVNWEQEKIEGWKCECWYIRESINWRTIANCLYKLYKDVLLTEKANCCKCGGSGYIPAFSHIDNGICFDCWGTGGHFYFDKTAIETIAR